jgi:hypothetical protein
MGWGMPHPMRSPQSTPEITPRARTLTTSYTSQPYAAGTSFRWNVRACNQNGCSRWSEAWGFRTGAVQSGSCRVEVRFKPVLRISNHAFIVTSDSNSTTYFRGGPQSREETLSIATISEREFGNIIFGRIITSTGSYTRESIDWIVSPSGSQTVAILPRNCDEIDRELGHHLSDIERARINYNPLYRNSNSVIREALERAGYSGIAPVVRATAWDTQLP